MVRGAPQAVSVVLVLLLIIGATIGGFPAAAEELSVVPKIEVPCTRSEPGSSGLFTWMEAIPAPYCDSLKAYEEGRFLDVLADLRGLRPGEIENGRDDADFLRALALRGLGWNDLAISLLTSVLESQPPSPYYSMALAELVEIHYRGERMGAVVETFRHYFDRPLRTDYPDARHIADRFFEFGTLRSGRAKLSSKEKQLLASPDELRVRLKDQREQPADRVLYLSGQALFRLDWYAESFRTLRQIGLESPYYPYALYTIAQDLFALEKGPDALKVLHRLIRYPETRRYDRALTAKARLLEVRMLFESGALDRGIRAAASVPPDGPYADDARLLIAQGLMNAGRPALALVYAGNAGEEVRNSEVEGRQGLTLGFAYADLGDGQSAAKLFREAARRMHRARLDDSASGGTVARLRALAEKELSKRLQRENELRLHFAQGIRSVLAYKDWGGWSFGRLFRSAGVALGVRPYRILAMGIKPDAPEAAARDELWLAYLQSPHRRTVDLALRRLRELELGSADGTMESALRIVNAYLTWLEFGTDPGRPEATTAVARRAAHFVELLRDWHGFEIPLLDLDLNAPLRPQLAVSRRQLVVAASEGTSDSAVSLEQLTEARSDAAALLEGWIEGQLRRFLQDRAGAQERLELELDTALATTLASDASAMGAGRP